MVTSPPSPKTAIAVMADAPIPGFAKTRLIPAIGQHAAAVLQERLTERAVATALAANIGPVTIWGAPDASHDSFLTMVAHKPLTLRAQPAGDVGAGMVAIVPTAQGPILVMDTDCPALTPMHLRAAARALQDGADVALVPGEAGGYVLIGLRRPEPTLFDNIPWGTPRVLAETRKRIIARGLRLSEVPPLWSLDGEEALARMEREMPELALTAGG